MFQQKISSSSTSASSKVIVYSKILVLGHRGWIGGMVTQYLERRGIPYIVPPEDVRPENVDAFREFLKLRKPSHIFALIGRTHGSIGDRSFPTIDYLEQEGKLKENVRDNLFAPLSLAFLAEECGAHLTYLGTGCIFEYDQAHPCPPSSSASNASSASEAVDGTDGFREGDAPNFFGSAYSVVKGATDHLFLKFFAKKVLNLRIRMPITEDRNPRNFISKITSYKKICSIPNSMSVLPELLPFAVDLALKRMTGTLNLVNPGTISHDEILAMYRDIVDPTFRWENFSLEEQADVLAAGRSNNKLDTQLLEQMYPSVLPIRESVRRTLTHMVQKDRAVRSQKPVRYVEMDPITQKFVLKK
jgi:3,5-epimerase/4-reductase